MIKIENHLLRIDLDAKTLKEVEDILVERLSYLEDTGFFPFKNIQKIIAGKKVSWNVKIYLNVEIKEELIIMMQLILGGDWRKEINTMVNHYILGMSFSNRLFDIKKYKGGKILIAKKKDITYKVKRRIFSLKRKKCSV